MLFAFFRFTAKRGLEKSLQESKYKYKVAHWLQELARNATTFKLAGHTSLPLEATDKHVGSYLKARQSHFRILMQQFSLMVIFKVLVATGLLAIGGVLVMNGQMNIGQFVGAEIIVLLIIASIEKLVLSLETIYDVLTALEKIGQVTDLPLEQAKGIDLAEQCQQGGMEVDVQDVHFAYPHSEHSILKGLSLNIKRGEKVLLTGPNGSGKSTLLSTLAGLYETQQGQISYHELPQRNLIPESLRAVIGDYLTQEQFFEGTLLENITMGRAAATFENVKLMVSQLGLTSFVNQLPEGYHTMLDPVSIRFPASIMAKLLLARSLADFPKLLLLEDALIHLDQNDRKTVVDFITSEEREWTLVAVSNDPYLAQNCDSVVVLKDGQVAAKGTYETMKSLINLNPDDLA